MSKTKTHQYPEHSSVGETNPRVTFVYRLPQAFVAQAIQRDPSCWVEVPLPDGSTLGTPIHGANIQLPVLGNEYSIDWAPTDAGRAFSMHFFSYLQALALVRIFCNKGTGQSYVCTDASDEIMRMVLTLVKQTLEQKFGDANLKFYRDSEY